MRTSACLRCGTRRRLRDMDAKRAESGAAVGWVCSDRGTCDATRATLLGRPTTRMEERDGHFFRVTTLPDATRRTRSSDYGPQLNPVLPRRRRQRLA